MALQDIYFMAEILASAGVIASLLFVGIQLKRETRATLMDGSYRRQDGAREVFLTLASSPGLASAMAKLSGERSSRAVANLMDHHGLSLEEALRLNAYLTAVFRQPALLRRMKISSEERQNMEQTIVRTLKGAPGIWWEYGKEAFDPDFADYVDRLLAQSAAANA
ncbi:MAG: hypothetical protein R3360_00740 [Alphaproteobacteria bacterium]|nr:hypothetical protein [Alphaproteobacteria bacterium]